jgi:hypothetical protein
MKVCCLRDCFDCFLCSSRCALSSKIISFHILSPPLVHKSDIRLCASLADEYVRIFTELFGAALDSKASWVDMKVPIPQDGTLTTLNHRLADFFALDGNGIDHVDQFGSALTPADIASYWLVNRALQFWPTDNALNWSSEAECDTVLFGDSKHFTKLPLPFADDLASVKGLQYLFTHNMGHHLLRRVVVPNDSNVYVEVTTHELNGPKMDKGMASLDVRVRFRIQSTASESTTSPSVSASGIYPTVEGEVKATARPPTSKLVFVEIEYENKVYRGGEPGFIDAIRAAETATLTLIQLREHGNTNHLIFLSSLLLDSFS